MKVLIGLLSMAALCHAGVYKRAAGDQNPKVFSALDDLSGGKTKLDAGQRADIYKAAQAGQDYPTLAVIPKAGVDCASVKPGFYANDGEGKCQAFDRCDVNGNLTSYLCPNMTLFNQITLVCDWFFNVDCAKVRKYYDYSNSRLYQEGSPLLDDEPDYVVAVTGAAEASSSASASGSATVKKAGKGKGKHAVVKRAAGDQNPKVYSALDDLSGGKTKLDAGQRAEIYNAAKAGQDYPTLVTIPKAGVDCASVKPGFYANDGEGKCQAFDRCDVNGNLTSYLCPNMTLFNQITLICDWFFNVDCAKVRKYYDYSNSRLYQEGSPLLDDEPDYVVAVTGAAQSSSSASASGSATVKKAGKGKGKHAIVKRAAGDQNPKVFSALDDLSGGKTKLDAGQRADIYKAAQAGQDYPTLVTIPKAGVDCASVKPGFYANDGEGKCQAFDRCDVNGNLTSYLCPNMTLFNQITLVCDWFFNVDCAKVRKYYDYSNSRLYQEGSPLLDDEPDYVVAATGAAEASSSASASGSATVKKAGKGKGKHAIVKRAAGNQSPKVFSALDDLSGGKTKLDAGQRAELYKNAQAGQDYPTLSAIPAAGVDCASVKPGFYANDGAGKCQAFDRCDVNGNLTSYLCPNMTLFNQITLICDWFYNVDCAKVRQYYDYSNSRLYQEGSPLLDDEPDYVVAATGAAQSSSSASASGSVTVKKAGKKGSKKGVVA